MERARSSRPERPLFGAIGRTIRLARTARGWSQLELADRAGLSGPYVSQIETGAKRPSSESLLAIADALDVPMHELFAEAATPTFALGVDSTPQNYLRRMSGPPPEPIASAPAAMSAPLPPPARAREWRAFERVSFASEAPQLIDAADRLQRMVAAYDSGAYRSIGREQLYLATTALEWMRTTTGRDAEAIARFADAALAEQIDDFERWERTGST